MSPDCYSTDPKFPSQKSNRFPTSLPLLGQHWKQNKEPFSDQCKHTALLGGLNPFALPLADEGAFELSDGAEEIEKKLGHGGVVSCKRSLAEGLRFSLIKRTIAPLRFIAETTERRSCRLRASRSIE